MTKIEPDLPEWEDFADVLREEIKETGWLLHLLKDKIAEGDEFAGFADLPSSVTEQVRVVSRAIEAREHVQQRLAERVTISGSPKIQEILVQVPPRRVALFEALLDENQRLAAECDGFIQKNPIRGEMTLAHG